MQTQQEPEDGDPFFRAWPLPDNGWGLAEDDGNIYINVLVEGVDLEKTEAVLDDGAVCLKFVKLPKYETVRIIVQ